MWQSFFQVTLGDLAAALPAVFGVGFLLFQLIRNRQSLKIEEVSIGGFNLRAVPGFRELSAWKVYKNVTVVIRAPAAVSEMREEFAEVDSNKLVHVGFQVLSEAYEKCFSAIMTVDNVEKNMAVDPMTRRITVAYINVYELMLRSAKNALTLEEAWEYFGKSISLCQRIDPGFGLNKSGAALRYGSLFSLATRRFGDTDSGMAAKPGIESEMGSSEK